MIIGLSGGCGSGKSTVADIIAQQGFSTKTIKADHMIHDILKNERVKEVLTRWWGTWILSEGEIDHARIATIVFNHKDQLLRLERYMHPMVKLRIKKDLKDIDGFDFVLLDAPLLFESGLDKICDATIFVDTPYEKRKQRVHETRGWSESDLINRESVQMPLEAKQSKCTWVIENHDDISELRQQLKRMTPAFLQSRASKGW
jgi:dephospho-CoA kinase